MASNGTLITGAAAAGILTIGGAQIANDPDSGVAAETVLASSVEASETDLVLPNDEGKQTLEDLIARVDDMEKAPVLPDEPIPPVNPDPPPLVEQKPVTLDVDERQIARGVAEELAKMNPPKDRIVEVPGKPVYYNKENDPMPADIRRWWRDKCIHGSEAVKAVMNFKKNQCNITAKTKNKHLIAWLDNAIQTLALIQPSRKIIGEMPSTIRAADPKVQRLWLKYNAPKLQRQ